MAFQYDKKAAESSSFVAWKTVLHSWGIFPDEARLRSWLLERVGTYHEPVKHSTSIYNYGEVELALKEAGGSLSELIRRNTDPMSPQV